MSLLDLTEPSASNRAARQVRLAIRDGLDKAVETVKQIHTQIWMMDIDPQDVFDEFTTHGGDYIAARDATVDFIQAIAVANDKVLADYIEPEWYQPPAGKDLQVNVDGSITVIDV